MAIYKGRSGSLFVDAPNTTPQSAHSPTAVKKHQITQITEWSISGGPGVADVTEFGDTWVERVTTINDWSGSARGFVDPELTAINQAEIFGLFLPGIPTAHSEGSGDVEDVIIGVFEIASGEGFYGHVIPSFEVTGNVGGVFEVSFSFQGAGILAHSAALTVS